MAPSILAILPKPNRNLVNRWVLANFREDVTVNGQINSSDISFVQAHSGTGLP
jgi:hypothetical protein